LVIAKSHEFPALYIPHGSDNTSLRRKTMSEEEALYIPHGSDNTSAVDDWLIRLLDFISHMVQIIRKNRLYSCQVVNTLYPTWFR